MLARPGHHRLLHAGQRAGRPRLLRPAARTMRLWLGIQPLSAGVFGVPLGFAVDDRGQPGEQASQRAVSPADLGIALSVLARRAAARDSAASAALSASCQTRLRTLPCARNQLGDMMATASATGRSETGLCARSDDQRGEEGHLRFLARHGVRVVRLLSVRLAGGHHRQAVLLRARSDSRPTSSRCWRSRPASWCGRSARCSSAGSAT